MDASLPLADISAASNISATPGTPETPAMGFALEMPNMPSPIKLEFGSPMTGEDPNVSFSEMDNARLRERHKNLQVVMKNLQQQVQAYKTGTKNMVKAAKALEVDNGKLRAKYAARKNKLKQVLDKLNEREAELSALKAHVVELEERLAADADADETETETESEADDSVEVFSHANESITTSMELAKALQTQQDLEEEIKDLTLRLAQLEGAAEERDAVVAERDALAAELDTEKTKLFSMSKNCCVLADQLKAAKAEIQAQSETLDAIRTREAETCDDHAASHAVALTELESELSSVRATLDDTLAANADLKAELADATHALAAASEEIDDLHIHASLPNKEQSEHIAKLEDALSAVNSELEATHDALGAADARASKAEGEAELALCKLRDMTNEHASIEAERELASLAHTDALASASFSAFVRGAALATTFTSVTASLLAYFFLRRSTSHRR